MAFPRLVGADEQLVELDPRSKSVLLLFQSAFPRSDAAIRDIREDLILRLLYASGVGTTCRVYLAATHRSRQSDPPRVGAITTSAAARLNGVSIHAPARGRDADARVLSASVRELT